MRTIVISPVVVSEDGDKELPFGSILLVSTLRHILHIAGQVVSSSRLRWRCAQVKLGPSCWAVGVIGPEQTLRIVSNVDSSSF